MRVVGQTFLSASRRSRDLSANGQAIVMVTHDTVLAHRAGRMITMEDGMIVKDERTTAS